MCKIYRLGLQIKYHLHLVHPFGQHHLLTYIIMRIPTVSYFGAWPHRYTSSYTPFFHYVGQVVDSLLHPKNHPPTRFWHPIFIYAKVDITILFPVRFSWPNNRTGYPLSRRSLHPADKIINIRWKLRSLISALWLLSGHVIPGHPKWPSTTGWPRPPL